MYSCNIDNPRIARISARISRELFSLHMPLSTVELGTSLSVRLNYGELESLKGRGTRGLYVLIDNEGADDDLTMGRFSPLNHIARNWRWDGQDSICT